MITVYLGFNETKEEKYVPSGYPKCRCGSGTLGSADQHDAPCLEDRCELARSI